MVTFHGNYIWPELYTIGYITCGAPKVDSALFSRRPASSLAVSCRNQVSIHNQQQRKCGSTCPISAADSQWIDADFRLSFTNSIAIVFSTRCGSSFCSTSSPWNSWQSTKPKMTFSKNWILLSTLSNHRLVFRNQRKWKQFSCGIRGTATLVSHWTMTLLSGNFN